MANKFLRSGATGTNSGTSWANAWTSITSAPAGMAAGDDLFIAHDHSQTSAINTLTFPGTRASPNRLLCVNDSANYASSSGATPAAGTLVSSPSALIEGNTSTYTVNGSLYAYGLIVRCASAGSNTMLANAADTVQAWEKTAFQHRAPSYGGGVGRFIIGAAESSALRVRMDWKDCTLEFNSTSTNRVGISVAADWNWRGGSITSLTATAINLFQTKSGEINWDGIDLSTMPTGTVIADEDWAGGPHAGAIVRMRNCRMPSGWAGTLQGGGRKVGNSMVLTALGYSNKYRVYAADYWGDVIPETTIVRTGGASDGTNALPSWKIVTQGSAAVNFPLGVFYTPPMFSQFVTTGSKTATVEIANSSLNLKDDEIWIEVMAMGVTGSPQTLLASSRKADLLASGTTLTSSSETWGGSPTYKQKMSVSFTVNEAGPVTVRVCAARPSTTVYVDPRVTIT